MITDRELFRKIKGVFKPPVKSYYFGKILHGTPYYYPWNFNRTILTIRKERPKFLRCNHFKLFGWEISYGWPVYITWYGLGWKDKYGSPREEWVPSFQIYFFQWQFCIHWNAPDMDNDDYYERIIWYVHYSDCDLKKAEETWPWSDYKSGVSSWDRGYLIK